MLNEKSFQYTTIGPRTAGPCIRVRKCSKLWLSFLISNALAKKDDEPSALSTIRRIGDILCFEAEFPNESSKQACLEMLCNLASKNCIRLGWVWPSSEREHPSYFEEDEFNINLMTAAALTNNASVFQRILAKGYDPLRRGSVFTSSPLCAAASKGHNDILEILLSSDAPGQQRTKKILPVSTAVVGGHLESFELSLQSRWSHFEPNHTFFLTFLRAGFRSPSTAIVLRTLELVGPRLPILNKSLPEYSYTRESTINYSFLAAVENGPLDLVTLLLEMGASIDGVERYFHYINPLSVASINDYGFVVKLLLEQGANPNPHNYDNDPLSLAASRSYVSIFRLLLNFGAEIDHGSPSAILYSIEIEDEATICLMRARGAGLQYVTD